MPLNLRNVAVSLVLFTSMVSGIGLFISAGEDAYGTGAPSAFDSLQDDSAAIQDNIDQARNESQQIGGGIAEGLFVLKSVWNVIKLSLDSLSIVTDILGTFGGVLPFALPQWFVSLVYGISVIAVIYAIVTLYRGVTA